MYNNIRSTARTSTLSVVFNIALKLFVNEICQKKKKKGIDALGWVEISKTISNYRDMKVYLENSRKIMVKQI